MRRLLRLAATGLTILLVLASATLLFTTRSFGAASLSFTNFELSSVVGTTCPGSAACTNFAAEPAIRADKAGNFYSSSENGLGSGTDAWKSSDAGKHYTALPSPNALSQGFPVAPGGGDTDLSVAPVKNGSGFYNVYVASLNLANVDVSTSMDGGKTFTLNPTSATIPGDDREWIAADGASKVCISYHDVATFNINVNCSTNAGATFTQLGDAIDVNHAFLINNNAIGNLQIDPATHLIYQTFSGIHDASEVVCGEQGTCGFHTVWMAVSSDGGQTFSDHIVYNNPNNQVSYGHQFVNVSIDSAGDVFSVFTDNHNVFYSTSASPAHGATWTAPIQVNKAPSNTAIFPWSVANNKGGLDIVWYGTSYFDGVNPPDNYPSSAAWFVYLAQNGSALKHPTSFTQVQATPIIHFGGVCESGVTCSGNRDLFDDFGVAVNPMTGLASIAYSDDQFTNDANNPPQPGCTASTSNSGSCDHTAVATQLSGSGI